MLNFFFLKRIYFSAKLFLKFQQPLNKRLENNTNMHLESTNRLCVTKNALSILKRLQGTLMGQSFRELRILDTCFVFNADCFPRAGIRPRNLPVTRLNRYQPVLSSFPYLLRYRPYGRAPKWILGNSIFISCFSSMVFFLILFSF